MKSINTLWNILEHYGIEIPPIQRDFAQGRETEQANKIRENFLDSIFYTLENNEKLSLDFVYGKIYGLRNEEEHIRNKNAIQSLINSVKDYALTIDLTLKDITVEDKASNRSDLVYLIPLDGQQRLTTLFLVHWYIAKRLNKKHELSILSRFRYKTRKSSASFLKLLTDDKLVLKFEIDENKGNKNIKEKKLYSEIIDLEFFSSSWLNDPTVKAVLIMLQEIHTRLQLHSDEQLLSYWENLTKKQDLWFDFLDLKDFNLSDELYVKMNARGKQLSSFENFKAWLFGLIKDKNLIEASVWENYSLNFDITWNDIFWSNKGEDVFDVDNAYFNFFKLLFLYDNIKLAKLNDTNFNRETKEFKLIDIVTNNKTFDWEYLCDDLFKTNIKKYLDFLSYCEEFFSVDKYLKEFFEFLFSEKGIKPNWRNLIKYYITFSFLSHKAKALKEYVSDDFEQLNHYHRILFNLFDNAIIDNQSLYQNAILEIDLLNNDLKDKKYSITDWVENIEYSGKSVFNEQQMLEEVLKYKLCSNEEWRNLIFEAEQTTYFERQLNFWFYKAGISLAKRDFDLGLLSNPELKNNFKNTTQKINELFDGKGINRSKAFSERIFERALLSKSDYLLNEKGYKCFGRNSGRDVSWKRLFFRDRNSEQTNHALLEIFDLDFSNVKESFNSYINKNVSNNAMEEWRKTFVLNKVLFEYLGDLRYVRKIDNHEWILVKDSYKTYIGPHYELFSLDFFTRFLNGKKFPPFDKIEYYPAPKSDVNNFPCAYLDWETESFHYAVDIKYIYGKYCLIFFSKNVSINDTIILKLLDLNYTLKDDYFFKDVSIESELIDEISKLTTRLSTELAPSNGQPLTELLNSSKSS